MRSSFLLRQLISWIACFALLFNGFVPALAAAFPGKQADGLWVEICSANGSKALKLIAVSADADQKTPTDQMQSTQSKVHKGHCANCLPHADHAVLINTALSDIQPAKIGASFPPLFYHSPKQLFSWASAQPRAPPFLT